LSKAIEAFRNIGEVSEELGVKKHVLRFWEARFPQLKPMKRGGGRRLYRPADVELLRGIRDLLQNSGYTIKGVQRLLREEGVEHVKAAGAHCAVEPPSPISSRRSAPPPPGKVSSMRLSPLEVATLRKVVAELDACQSILAAATAAGTGSSELSRERAS
jgi:DNA-binding transcriptional MerR regulator